MRPGRSKQALAPDWRGVGCPSRRLRADGLLGRCRWEDRSGTRVERLGHPVVDSLCVRTEIQRRCGAGLGAGSGPRHRAPIRQRLARLRYGVLVLVRDPLGSRTVIDETTGKAVTVDAPLSAMRTASPATLPAGSWGDCSTKIIYQQEVSESGRTATDFGLSTAERDQLPDLQRGEGLWRVARGHLWSGRLQPRGSPQCSRLGLEWRGSRIETPSRGPSACLRGSRHRVSPARQRERHFAHCGLPTSRLAVQPWPRA